MFRPLLSSVPSTTFYVGKTSSAHHSLISRNSSVTTSTNASSDQGLNSALDTEGSEHIEDDLGSECGKPQHHDVHEAVYPLEKVHAITEDVGQGYHNGLMHGDLDGGLRIESYAGNSQDFNDYENVIEINSTTEDYHVKGNKLGVDSFDDMAVCSQCGCTYPVINPGESETMLCPECERKIEPLMVTLLESKVVPECSGAPINNLDEHKPFEELGPEVIVPEFPNATDTCEVNVSQEEVKNFVQVQCNEQGYDFLQKSLPSGERYDQETANQQGVGQPSVNDGLHDPENEDRNLHRKNVQSNLKIDASGNAGISVLLRSNSSKGPIIQGRSFTATTISCDNLSYARESTSSLRSSIGHSSTSVSSSADLTLVKQTDGRMQRQLSRRKSDLESYKNDMNRKRHGSLSSFSDISNQNHSIGLQTSAQEEHGEVTFESMDINVVEEQRITLQGREPLSEGTEVDNPDKPITESTISEEGNYDSSDIRMENADASEVLYDRYGARVDDTSVAPNPNHDESITYENGGDLSENAKDLEALPGVPESHIEEECVAVTIFDGVDVVGVPDDSLFTASEIKCEDDSRSASGSQLDENSENLKRNVDDCLENKIPMLSEELSSVLEHNTNSAQDISGMIKFT